MTTEEWYEGLTAELLAQSPFRRSEYFKRFAAGTLTREQAWAHIAQHYLLIAWFPRIFSGIHTRCEDLEVRKDSGASGYCTIRSQSESGAEVGRADFRFDGDETRIDRVVTLRTTARGTTAELLGCHAD